jgi:hypothetical protein
MRHDRASGWADGPWAAWPSGLLSPGEWRTVGSCRRPGSAMTRRGLSAGPASCSTHRIVSAANEFAGSQVGGRCRQAPGDIRPHPARVLAGKRHVGRLPALPGGGPGLYGMQDVRGPNLLSSTLFRILVRVKRDYQVTTVPDSPAGAHWVKGCRTWFADGDRSIWPGQQVERLWAAVLVCIARPSVACVTSMSLATDHRSRSP